MLSKGLKHLVRSLLVSWLTISQPQKLNDPNVLQVLNSPKPKTNRRKKGRPPILNKFILKSKNMPLFNCTKLSMDNHNISWTIIMFHGQPEFLVDN